MKSLNATFVRGHYSYLFHIIAICIVVATCSAKSAAETVTLYNNNGQGGIHRTTASVVVDEGQYYVDFPVKTYNGKTRTERLKVYRVKDSARLLYNQDKWAEKYAYAVERSSGPLSSSTYYFNMRSQWKPSLTDNPHDPDRVIPIRKLSVYQDDFRGGYNVMKAVLIKTQGKLMLYWGDDFFAALIEPNDKPLDYAPSWSRKFKYRAQISGINVYFNLMPVSVDALRPR